ncbi:hypothetical protein BC939DRAFT_215250 [Gamsiella multidivaricata]|uniref:uncharacterized protein n=1 Tax=Gamsiella multidivaricata TaxID=101098 RepID=UPI00221E55AD|nr:uncharacterized protein BC939DRAFT_215250 [Gamsiella multidivaricata]KAI7820986.1 hypothetical protein BC939DRAFT_215250 [Gamsiella multidivaricata]
MMIMMMRRRRRRRRRWWSRGGWAVVGCVFRGGGIGNRKDSPVVFWDEENAVREWSESIGRAELGMAAVYLRIVSFFFLFSFFSFSDWMLGNEKDTIRRARARERKREREKEKGRETKRVNKKKRIRNLAGKKVEGVAHAWEVFRESTASIAIESACKQYKSTVVIFPRLYVHIQTLTQYNNNKCDKQQQQRQQQQQ